MDRNLYDPHKYDYLHCDTKLGEIAEVGIDIRTWVTERKEDCTCELCTFYWEYAQGKRGWSVLPYMFG